MSNSDRVFDPNYKPTGYYNCRRGEMLRFVPQNVTRVLEIGCGTGEFGKILKSQRNVEVWGIELSKEIAEVTKGKLDNVIVGDIESDNIPLPSEYFDCIVFNDVLEHLKYPWIVLRKLRDNLKHYGWIISSIPNVRYYENIKELLIRKEWQYVDAGILDKTHLRFFTINSIKDMFKECGYHVIKIEGINGGKFPWKFGFLNLILLNALDDMRFLQFACVAQKVDS